jgi:hypothetical protein
VNLEHIHKLVELFHHLFKDLIIPDNNKGHAGDFVVLGRADTQGVDIEATSAKKSGDPGQDPEAVLDYDRDGVAHKKEKMLNTKK